MSEETTGIEQPKLTHGTSTIGQLVDASMALQRLAALPLRGAIAMRVARLLRSAETELVAYETARVALVKSLGEEREDGSSQVTPDNLADFAKQIAEMRAEVFTLPCAKLSVEDLGDGLMTAGDLILLDWLFGA